MPYLCFTCFLYPIGIDDIVLLIAVTDADPDGTYDIFRGCRDREELVNLKDLTVDQFSILIYGLSYTEEFAGVCMEIKGADGKIIRADLGESIRQGDIIEMLD